MNLSHPHDAPCPTAPAASRPFLAKLLAAIVLSGCVAAATGCAAGPGDEDVEQTTSALTRRRFGGATLGGGLKAGGQTAPADPYARCSAEFDACLKKCKTDECDTKCDMAFINCVDDANGEGGPVAP